MAEQNRKDENLARTERPVPSKAEGERDPGTDTDEMDRPVPSQAEGDRETIDDDLKQKR